MPGLRWKYSVRWEEENENNTVEDNDGLIEIEDEEDNDNKK